MAFITGNTSVSSSGITVPKYTTAGRPSNAANNFVIYNTTTHRLEIKLNGEWKEVYRPDGGGYLYRQIITKGYVMGGYQSSSPWKNVNRMQHSTDVMTNLGDLLTNSGAYTSGVNNLSKGFLWSTDNTFSGSSAITSAFYLATETGAGLNSNWNMRAGRNDCGTGFKETEYAYITGGGSSDIDVFNLSTETMQKDFGTGSLIWDANISGNDDSNHFGGTSAVSDQTQALFWGGGSFLMKFATTSVTSTLDAAALRGDYKMRYTVLGGGSTGQQKGINSKLGRGYAGNEGDYNGGYNLRRMVFSTETYTTVSKPIGNSGEENFDMGQDHQYMMGCYDGAQNNRGWKFSYTTDTGSELGSGSIRTGVPGGSSGHCVWGYT